MLTPLDTGRTHREEGQNFMRIMRCLHPLKNTPRVVKTAIAVLQKQKRDEETSRRSAFAKHGRSALLLHFSRGRQMPFRMSEKTRQDILSETANHFAHNP
jgi:hypothetical protein